MIHVYIESKSGNKKDALQNVLSGYDTVQLKEKTFSLPEVATTLSEEATMNASRRRALSIAVNGILPNRALAVGIHKGWHVDPATKEAYLVLSTTILQVGETICATACSKILVPQKGLGELLENGTHPYDAYEAITGIDISKKKMPVYEIITKRKEVVWMQKNIQEALDMVLKKIEEVSPEKQKAIHST